MKIGIIKEGKTPVDHRVPFTPELCVEIKNRFSVNVVVQPSQVRAIPDSEYEKVGIQLQDDLTDCDILFGVKEVPKEDLIANKTYFFFSHTIKAQAYNRTLLQHILEQNITLIDYECLKSQNQRVVAFGRFAGIVGAYNGLKTYGKKHELYDLKPAHECKDINELNQELKKVSAPGIRVVLTGGGRVSNGAIESLKEAGITSVNENDFVIKDHEPKFIQVDSNQYNRNKNLKEFDFNHFYSTPEEYESTFSRFLNHTDLLIAGAYWDPKAPKLFEFNDIQQPDWRISVIADITCDIDGSIPTTVRSTTIDDPVFDISKDLLREVAPYSPNSITTMAVDNLPCEVPLDASSSFGQQLLDNVLPELLTKENSTMIHEATIAKNGKLNTPFEYLKDFVAKK